MPPDHCSRLQQRPAAGREAINTRREQQLEARGHGLGNSMVIGDSATRKAHIAALNEKARDLFGEKRVSLGLAGYNIAKRVRDLVNSEPGADDSQRLLCGKRRKSQRDYPGPFKPGRPVLGPARMRDQKRKIAV